MSTITRAAVHVALVLLFWSSVMLAMPLIGPAGRQVAVVGDASMAVRAIVAAGGQVGEVRRGATLARARDPGFVRRLYANGAWAVVEGRIAGGCFAKAGA